MTIRIDALYRYPVKGLSPERLGRAALRRGAYFPGDRVFAIENGPAGFDAEAPVHQAKIKFLMLMRNEALARLSTRYEDATGTLIVEEGGREALRAVLATSEGRLALEAFMRRFLPKELRGPPKVLTAPEGFRFTDSRSGFVSLINRASVQALEDMVGAPVDPLRFRGNLLLDGLAPWAELDLVGQVLETNGGVRLKAIKRIQRCAATNVDPQSAIRDLDIPRTLMERLGHMDCGVYAEVITGGTLREGDGLAVVPPAQATLPLH
jgi:uncharacterized protein YcbX